MSDATSPDPAPEPARAALPSNPPADDAPEQPSPGAANEPPPDALPGSSSAASDGAAGEGASAAGAASPRPTERAARPSFVFFGIVSAIALLLDIGSKAWAEIVLLRRPPHDPAIVIIPDHLTFTLAYNKGGAWGLLQDANEPIRLPFFVLVSALAVLFIVSLYGKLAPNQTALKWGLPLVFGGALGNLSDRITRSSVIDFIDYRADWVLAMNRAVAKVVNGWALTDHWPTFNVADIAICVGVGLMAVDMFTSRRATERKPSPPAVARASDPPRA